MKQRNLIAVAWAYYKLYGPRFFFLRLHNALADILFGRLAPIVGHARRLPRREMSTEHSALPDIFFLSGNEWELRTQRPQQLAAALVREGCTVHFCAPSSCPSSVTGWRVTKKMRRLWHARFFSKKMYRLKDIDSPHNYEGFTESFKKYVEAARQGRDALILVQQPVWMVHLRALDGQLPIFYDCIDDHSDFPNAPKATKSLEKELVECSSGIIYTSNNLSRLNPDYPEEKTLILRNACEYEHFIRKYPFSPDHPGPARPCKPKVIGYHGALGEWFDSDLIAQVALAFPEHTVRLVGASIPAVRERLGGVRNIELVGEVDYKRLPAYVHTFDIGLLPFRIQPLTLGINPVKIYEYLAAGLPVVAVPLPEMAQFGDLVRTGQGEAFIKAVREELTSEPSQGTFAARQAFARKETWDTRAKALIAFLYTADEYSSAP
jgi:glycosyltransferase involved in cell wall biosynthesis